MLELDTIGNSNFEKRNSQHLPYKTELEKLYTETSFKEGKRYFQFGNYECLFKFIDENESETYNRSFPDEYLVAIALSYDLDDYFHLVFNEKQDTYYLRNGFSSDTPQTINGKKRLLKPIKISNSLSEMFGNENFSDILIDLNDQEYHLYCERQFHGGSEIMNDALPKTFIPREDLRLYVQRTCLDCYLTHHEEYNSKNFKTFLSRKSIENYFDAESFFSKRLHPEDFIAVLRKINQDLGRQRFLLIEFFPSGWYAIIDTDDVPKTVLADYLKYGLIYNKIDVEESIYDLLK